MREWLLQNQQMPPDLIAAIFAKPLHKAGSHWAKTLPALQDANFVQAMNVLEKTLHASSNSEACLQTAWKKRWEKSLSQVRKRMSLTTAADLTSLHRLRISYKKLRYLLELQLDAGAELAIDREQLGKWQNELGHVSDFRFMADYGKKMPFPDALKKQLMRQGAQHARHCVKNRRAFSHYLQELEDQVEQL